jgi:hypothetical protein
MEGDLVGGNQRPRRNHYQHQELKKNVTWELLIKSNKLVGNCLYCEIRGH